MKIDVSAGSAVFRPSLLALAIASILSQPQAFARTYTWTTSSSDNWTTSTRWTKSPSGGNGYPNNSNDDVVINIGSTDRTITIDQSGSNIYDVRDITTSSRYKLLFSSANDGIRVNRTATLAGAIESDASGDGSLTFVGSSLTSSISGTYNLRGVTNFGETSSSFAGKVTFSSGVGTSSIRGAMNFRGGEVVFNGAGTAYIGAATFETASSTVSGTKSLDVSSITKNTTDTTATINSTTLNGSGSAYFGAATFDTADSTVSGAQALDVSSITKNTTGTTATATQRSTPAR